MDIVDIFRSSEAALGIARDAIAIGARVVWMQLGVRNDEAARLAEDAGLQVVMNRCPKIEYGRLSGETELGRRELPHGFEQAAAARAQGRTAPRDCVPRLERAYSRPWSVSKLKGT